MFNKIKSLLSSTSVGDHLNKEYQAIRKNNPEREYALYDTEYFTSVNVFAGKACAEMFPRINAFVERQFKKPFDSSRVTYFNSKVTHDHLGKIDPTMNGQMFFQVREDVFILTHPRDEFHQFVIIVEQSFADRKISIYQFFEDCHSDYQPGEKYSPKQRVPYWEVRRPSLGFFIDRDFSLAGEFHDPGHIASFTVKPDGSISLGLHNDKAGQHVYEFSLVLSIIQEEAEVLG